MFGWLRNLSKEFLTTVRFQNFSNLGGNEIEGTVGGANAHDSCLPESVVSAKK